MSRINDTTRAVFISAVVALVTLAVFWRLSGSNFIFLDDFVYVTGNQHVQAGLSWAGVKWAFQSVVCANWHPLTMLSHMLDCQLFGVKAGRHHLVNVALHIADSCLLFVWLRRLTGALWKSALVAALFAWHPLHVESVAWVSERKDVLSTFFFLLALIAYTRRLEESPPLLESSGAAGKDHPPSLGGHGATRIPKSKVYYALTLLWFALGLMSKPMVVTLPFVLLLVDYWNAESIQATPVLKLPWRRWILEKMPFFALSGISCVVTFLAQKSEGAVETFVNLPLEDRIANAGVSYLRYLGKIIWPTDLGIFYPSPAWADWQVAGAAIVLACVTWLVIHFRERRPWLALGWFWFLGTLVPVIGLVQVGRQSMADRYAYVPSIGLFIVLAWALGEWAQSATGRRATVALASLMLASCVSLTWVQVGYWKDSGLLFKHDIKVAGYNYIACRNLAAYLLSVDKGQESLFYLDEALKVSPADEPRLKPVYAQAHYDLGADLLEQGHPEQAEQHFTKSVDYEPDNARGYFGLGEALAQAGKTNEAIQKFRTAARLQPDWPDPHSKLGAVLAAQGNLADALAEVEAAVKADPNDPSTQTQLAGLLSEQGRKPEALAHYREAVQWYRQALHSTPDSPEFLNNLAWLLATNPNAEIRNGADAVTFARHACEVTGWKRATLVGTLAAAYAETGQFVEAAKTARKAREIALAAGDQPLVARNEELAKLYDSGKPYREQ